MKPMHTDRTLTELDHVRLKNLVQRQRQGVEATDALDAIEDMLDEALLVPSTRVAPDVVTMYSQVVVADATRRNWLQRLAYRPGHDH